MLPRSIIAALICTTVFSIPSCTPAGPSGFIKKTDSTANDHIMLVRRTPPTFGFKRLSALAAYYPDLGVFLGQKDLPEYIAETNKNGNRYIILYYPSTRKAYACRSAPGESKGVEFSGPYPITDGELATLNGLKNKVKPTPMN